MAKNKYDILVDELLPLVGGAENVNQAVHCMTRLRLGLKDYTVADIEKIKKVKGVVGCQETGGQLQIIIGTDVANVYDVFVKKAGISSQTAIDENLDAPKQKLTGKVIANKIFGYLSGSLTPLIPVLIASSLCKTIVAIFGPTLLGVLSETSDLYTLFTFMGDAGFYFLPFIIGWSAAKKLEVNPAIAMLLAGIMMHPTFMAMATEGTAFTVYGIPSSVQNYSSTILPMLLVVWIMSYVEKFLKKYMPEVIKVFAVPFLTVLIMTPLALCVLGPLGSFLGNYVCKGIIALYNVAGPVAVMILGATFGLLVCTGMHQLLFVYLYTSFPMLGYDGFLLPGVFASSWVGLGIAVAAMIKFKKKENKTMVASYLVTWLFGGVGEPMLYGFQLRYRTALYASIISGAITGLIEGFLGLKAYVLNPSNGIYSLTAFIGGPKSNYVALGISLVIAIVSGFVMMMILPLKDEAE